MQKEYIPIQWRAHEYEHKEKSADWFWVLAIVAITGVITAIILKNILFAILIIVGTLTLALYAIRKPNLTHFEINNRGIRIDNSLHPYISLDSFWVIDTEEERVSTLIIKSSKTLMPYIIIPLDNSVSSFEIRECLLTYLDEEEYEEPLSYKFMDYLGF